MKKFEKEAMIQGNDKFEDAIWRMEKLYDPIYGDAPMRSEFDRDYTRIINCNAYRRLKHKTQVFFSPKNDHICTRIEHVNLVDSISNTIANYLGLNSELTKAIAVTHDIGHSPFGHQGEFILSEIAQREYGEKFWHAGNGLHCVDDLELLKDIAGNERNLNLTYAVRDGILGHSGDPMISGQKPRDEFIDLKKFTHSNKYAPYTWEACVVKIADNISYLGRDLEDAKEMKLLTDRDLLNLDKMIENIRVNNTSIIGYLTGDLCKNSSVEEGLKFSEEARITMERIKKFNYEKIYKNEKIQPTVRYFKVVMNEIFYTLKREYNGTATNKNLRKMKRYYPVLAHEFSNWLEKYSNCQDRDETKYFNKVIYDLTDIKNYSRAIIDYMAGMTDQYIISIYDEIVKF
ncbi:MAG: HD domain-containing protein [Clostridia bacterium]|nr:HD domain-containing protein [Clostridia bacterium]